MSESLAENARELASYIYPDFLSEEDQLASMDGLEVACTFPGRDTTHIGVRIITITARTDSHEVVLTRKREGFEVEDVIAATAYSSTGAEISTGPVRVTGVQKQHQQPSAAFMPHGDADHGVVLRTAQKVEKPVQDHTHAAVTASAVFFNAAKSIKRKTGDYVPIRQS